MDLWNARRQSQLWLDTELQAERAHIERGFELLDRCTHIFNEIGSANGSTTTGGLARVCAVTTAKARNLLLSCFSLALDGLSQESGALLRPLIETIELLTYLRLDRNRIEEIFESKLPSAGNIAKAINGQFQFLRDFLNENASHFSFTHYSVIHLLDRQKIEIRATETQTCGTLKGNLGALSAFFVFLLCESAGCLYVTGYQADLLADECEAWKARTQQLFPLNSILHT